MKAGKDHVGILVEKFYEDEIDIANGKKLYFDPLYQPTLHVRTYGTAIAPPMRLTKGKDIFRDFVKEGDRIYFKYTATDGDNNLSATELMKPDDAEGDVFMIPWNECYARVRNGEITPFPNVTLCEPWYGHHATYDEEMKTYVKKSNGIIIDHDVKPDPRIAKVYKKGADLPNNNPIDIKEGDLIFRDKHTNHSYEIEGKELYVVLNAWIWGITETENIVSCE